MFPDPPSFSGGYYTVKIKPGFRIISLNTNYCTRLNPWTLYDPVDPGNQLKWLVKELHSAELASEKVHILGHIPPDNRECTQAWLNNFLRIIDRFEHVVLAQYYGHTHRDEFRVRLPSALPVVFRTNNSTLLSVANRAFVQNRFSTVHTVTDCDRSRWPTSDRRSRHSPKTTRPIECTR